MNVLGRIFLNSGKDKEAKKKLYFFYNHKDWNL